MPTTSLTVGDRLQRRRLEVRARRLEQVLVALEDRLLVREQAGVVPPPLRHAIRDFQLELHELQRCLARPAGRMRAAGEAEPAGQAPVRHRDQHHRFVAVPTPN